MPVMVELTLKIDAATYQAMHGQILPVARNRGQLGEDAAPGATGAAGVRAASAGPSMPRSTSAPTIAAC